MVKAALEALAGVQAVETGRDGSLTAIAKSGASIFTPINALIQSKGFVVHDLALERGRMDEVFRTITNFSGVTSNTGAKSGGRS